MFSVRKVRPEDCVAVMGLVSELAEYENSASSVKLTPEQLCCDLFGEEKFCDCLVAQLDPSGELVGFALYNNAYSTWEGRMFYLEDLYVKPEYRKSGVGTKLIDELIGIALSKKCKRIHWMTLDWNELAISFYKKLGALDLSIRDGWHLFRLTEEVMLQRAHGEHGPRLNSCIANRANTSES